MLFGSRRSYERIVCVKKERKKEEENQIVLLRYVFIDDYKAGLAQD